jgi:hypothetical protein
MKIKFEAKIEQNKNIDAAYVKFPYDAMELFGVKGQVRIKALIDKKVLYRGSLAKMGMDCHILGITKAIRNEIGKNFGDTIEIELEQDLEPREIIIPEDALNLLKKNKKAKEIFERLSYTHKKEYIRWIEEAKKEETRKRRLEQFIQKLMEK